MVLSVVASFAQFLLRGLVTTLGTIFSLPFRFKFILLWLLALLFLLFNAPAFYGEESARQTQILMLYLVSLAFVFSQTREHNPLMSVSTAEFILTFAWAALVSVVAFKFVQPFNPERALLSSASIAILVTHALVVSIGEELLFRFAIPSLIPGPRIAAQTLSAFAFGFMHWTAYGGSWPNLLFASVLGLIFGGLTIRFRNGLIIAMAAHFVWNAFTLGFI